MEPITSQEASKAIGRLCVGGDWACSHGDFSGLREVVRQLCDYVPEPLHCELEAVSAACIADPEHASARWDALKSRIYREARE